ncbi:MAG: CxxxxCH/CxxCH domain-containing protein, partial [Desulfuromonadales bacterium]|nr:CxxxxCH/CxxCH domain-containing protein [Desulfuromonadales bacterium]
MMKNFRSVLQGTIRPVASGVLMAALLFIVQVSTAYAANSTTVGSIRALPGAATLTGSPSIDVTATYVGDDNANNQVRVEWGLEGVDFSLGNNLSAAHPAIPYSYTIPSLSNNQVYQVRVTIEDGDGTGAAKVFNSLRAYNPLIHNAVATGSGTTKWGSGWGTVDGGAQYGEFTCQTCHDPSSNNIKRIRSNWGALSATVPAKNNAETVVFNSSTDFALDDSGLRTSSNKVCNACHTITDHQRYDENSNGAQTDHYSSGDCVECHKHSTAFGTPNCSDCHGGGTFGATENNFWPDSADETTDNGGSENDSGEHAIHMARLAANDGMTIQELLDNAASKTLQIGYCERCHGANAGTSANHYQKDDVGEIAAFQNMSGGADANTAGVFAAGSCSSVDCHNGIATSSPDWYAGASSDCTMCHTAAGHAEEIANPTSGLHYHATNPTGAELHDNDFDSSSGSCTSCHTSSPSDGHFNGSLDDATAVFNFQSSAAIDVKLNVLADATDDTCAASCHSDGGNWYRFWSADAFDNTPFDTSSGAAIIATIADPLPARCSVCHGDFRSAWAEGTAHYNMDAVNTSSGASHNSQNPNVNEGADCVDCHVYPDEDTPGAGAARHENGKITLGNADAPYAPATDFTPTVDNTPPREGVYCAPCHEDTGPGDGLDSNTFELSAAFPGGIGAGNGIELVVASRQPEYTCFSGANGCHGDTSNNFWPNLDSTDPALHPNRGGAHYAHGTTIGELLAEQANIAVPGSRTDADGNGRVDATQEDRNKTCNFCHPMTWNPIRTVWESNNHRANTPETGRITVDVFGGNVFNGADRTGLYASGDPANAGEWSDNDTDGSTGFAYQLEEDPYNPGQGAYPLDHDAEYWQFVDAYKADPTVRHGVCSQVACHSNAPYTPNWYGDSQAPEALADLAGATHDTRDAHVAGETDQPGTVLLTWTAPGEDGSLEGRAYEYEVYYSNAPISDANVGSATRAGGSPTVYQKGIAQEMVVDGLTPDTSYYFAVRTKDTPHYKDDDNDGIHDVFVADGNVSPVAAVGPYTAHTDDMAPVFWGVDAIEAHDEPGVINLRWESARDHTLPIEYRLWYTTYSVKTHLKNGGILYDAATDPTGSNLIECFTAGAPPTPVGDSGGDYCIESAVSNGTSTMLAGLQGGNL